MKIKVILAMMSLIAFTGIVSACTVDEDKKEYDRKLDPATLNRTQIF
jgi:hypothetical protein